MSLDHEQASPQVQDSMPDPAPHKATWHAKLLRICLAVFCFEIGLFLLVFPWNDSWNFNYFQGLSPSTEYLWDTFYLRGALSGLGLVNIYIAFLEIYRLLRGVR